MKIRKAAGPGRGRDAAAARRPGEQPLLRRERGELARAGDAAHGGGALPRHERRNHSCRRADGGAARDALLGGVGPARVGAPHREARRAEIVSVQVLDCRGSGTIEQIVQGIAWATNNSLAHPDKRAVLSMSLRAVVSPPPAIAMSLSGNSNTKEQQQQHFAIVARSSVGEVAGVWSTRRGSGIATTK